LHHLFDTNDGSNESLPSIEFNNLSDREVEKIYLYLRAHSELYPTDSYLSLTATKEEIPVDSVENAAHLVIVGEAEGFYFMICKLSFRDIVVPDLGIFIDKNSINR
jgi:hypothetical protein